MSSPFGKIVGGKDLKPCAVCSRRFTPDRVDTHEAICQKTSLTTRKLFDVSQQRIGGTESEKITKKVIKSGETVASKMVKYLSVEIIVPVGTVTRTTPMCRSVRTFAVSQDEPPALRSPIDLSHQSLFSSVKKIGPSALSTNWRQKHAEFLQLVRQSKSLEARKDKCGKAKDLPLAPELNCNDFVQCPHCLRQFSPNSIERHILTCQKVMQERSISKDCMSVSKGKLSEVNVADK